MDIQTVKDKDGVYLVNDIISVPQALGNRDYLKVQEWLLEEDNNLSPTYSIEEIIEKKKAELDIYHNSDEVRILSINAEGVDHHFPMTKKGRGLINEQITDLERQISKGRITEAEAIFTYNNGGSIDLTLNQLIELLFEIMAIIKANYNKMVEHKNAIEALTTISEIEDYNYKEGYLINNTYSIT